MVHFPVEMEVTNFRNRIVLHIAIDFLHKTDTSTDTESENLIGQKFGATSKD